MSSYCNDCGERAVSKGVCSNCQEELYILENQGEYSDAPLSDEFMEKAAEQRRYLNQRSSKHE